MKLNLVILALLVSQSAFATGKLVAWANSRELKPYGQSKTINVYDDGVYSISVSPQTMRNKKQFGQLSEADTAKIISLAKNAVEQPISPKAPPFPACASKPYAQEDYYAHTEEGDKQVGTRQHPCGNNNFTNQFANQLMFELDKLLNQKQ